MSRHIRCTVPRLQQRDKRYQIHTQPGSRQSTNNRQVTTYETFLRNLLYYQFHIGQKEVEVALQVDAQLYRVLVSMLPVTLLYLDEESRLLTIDGTNEVLNLTPDTEVGKHLQDLLPEAWVQTILFSIDRARSTRTTQVLECSLIVSERRYEYEIRVALLEHAGSLVLLRDTTADSQAHSEPSTPQATFHTHSRVRQTSLSHMDYELRIPISAIVGTVNRLLHTSLTPEQQRFVEIIAAGADSLRACLDDPPALSSQGSGTRTSAHRPFNLHDCLERSIDLLAVEATEKNITLIYFIDDNVPVSITGDERLLRQVVVNILSNALTFTPAGEVVLLATSRLLETCEPCDTQKGSLSQSPAYPAPIAPSGSPRSYEIQIIVRDTGVGMTPEQLEQIAIAWTHTDTPVSQTDDSRGMGLTVCKHLMDLMDGTITLQSQPGQGSTCYLTFPAVAVAAPSPDYMCGNRSPLAGKHILLITQNTTRSALMKDRMQGWDMLPWAEDSVAAAFSRIHQGWVFDAAILDTGVEELQDQSLSAHLQHYYNARQLPLILLHSLGTHSMSNEHGESKIAAILTTPLKPAHLYRSLISIFTRPTPLPDIVVPSPQLDEHFAQRHPLRILIAEDSPVNQRVALLFLSRLGYIADVARTGLEVLSMMQSAQPQPYDAILMDIHMPDLDGLETTRRIREHWPRQEQPCIIAMTAHNQNLEEYIAAGMDYSISKSVRLEELSAILSRCPTRNQREAQFVQQQPFVIEQQEPGLIVQASAVTSHPSIDLQVIERLMATMGPDASRKLTELITIFLTHTARLRADLQHAADHGNAEMLLYVAHTLKSSSASLGALVLSQLCRQLETSIRAGNLLHAPAQSALVIAELTQVQAGLAAIRDRLV